MAQRTDDTSSGSYEQRWGWRDRENYAFKARRGLDREIVEEISFMKNEPKWMRDFRLKAYERFERRPMPTWTGPDLTLLDFQNIFYFLRAIDQKDRNDWNDVPEGIRDTYNRLGIPEAEQKGLVSGVSAQYECLRGSTLVWTTRGMMPIKTVVAGDVVFSLDESTNQIVSGEVLATACSGAKEVFEIRARGSVIGASANHPFLVLRDERKPGRQRRRYIRRWVPVEDLRVGDFVAVASDLPDYGDPFELLTPDEAVFPSRSSVDLCWWMGVFVGDGYFHRRGEYDSVEIAVDPSDVALISELQRVGRELFGMDFTLAKDGFRLTARGTGPLASYLGLNGIRGNAHTKRFPDWIFEVPRNQRLAFLAGYVDADGYVRNHATARNPVLTSVSEAMLRDAKELAALCGIWSSSVVHVTNKHPHGPGRTLDAHQLHLSGAFDQLPCRSPRRVERLHRHAYAHRNRTAKGTDFRSHTSEMLGFARVDAIGSVGEELTYDIEVAGHHNFVAEGFVVHNSEVVYHKVQESLEAKGVIFTDMDTAVREYPELLQEYFAKVIPPNDNKLAALNSAVWSGGSFIYVPPGVQVDVPLQAYFRINAENVGQFERTLIIADEGAYVHYVEGCTAPVYSSDSLHSAVVELWARPHSRIRYTTIQNWAGNVYNLVTKRAVAEENSVVEWVDGNLGCLAQGERVTTRSGPKPIELLIPGEDVLSFDEHIGELVWRRVLGKKFSGRQPIREVCSGHRALRVTDNHPFYSEVLDPTRGCSVRTYVRADAVTSAIVPAESALQGLGSGDGALKTHVVEIRKVTVSDHLETVPTWDIEVEGTGNFVAEGFIVHNSKVTVKYPAVVLTGRKAHGEVLSLAMAGAGQHQDTGAKMTHAAPETTSTIISKSISKDGGITTYRGRVEVHENAVGSKSNVRCDALLLDEESKSNTFPYMDIRQEDVEVGHEASVAKIGDEQLFYLRSRGIPEVEAAAMIVRGFIEPIVKQLPMEYAVELNRLIDLQMEGSVG